MKIDRNTVRTINADIRAALAPVAEKHGVSINLGSSRFDETNYTTKVEVATIGTDGTVMSKEARDYNHYASVLGFTKALGETITMNGKPYTVVGYKPRSHRFPVLARCQATGNTYKLPDSVVK
jgi:hypothetical protein